MHKLILPLLILGILVYLIISLLLPTVINLIFGQKYQESIIYSMVLLIPIIFIPINAMFSSIVIYHGYKRFYTKLTLLTNIIQIILFIILIPLFKIWGVIISVIGIMIVTTLLNFIWFYHLPKRATKKTILTMQKGLKIRGYKVIYFNGKLREKNILKVIQSESLNKENYPLWVKILAKLIRVKYIM